jgi:hypothetical protein
MEDGGRRMKDGERGSVEGGLSTQYSVPSPQAGEYRIASDGLTGGLETYLTKFGQVGNLPHDELAGRQKRRVGGECQAEFLGQHG